MLCGLTGRDSRLSKLPLLRSSGGVACPVDVGRSIGDDPSLLAWLWSCSGWTKFSDDRPTAEVSIVIVGALGRRPCPEDVDMMLVVRGEAPVPDRKQGVSRDAL